MGRQTGLEPAQTCLEGRCPTIGLLPHIVSVFPRRARDTKAVGQLHIAFCRLAREGADPKEWYKKGTRLRHLLVRIELGQEEPCKLQSHLAF